MELTILQETTLEMVCKHCDETHNLPAIVEDGQVFTMDDNYDCPECGKEMEDI